MDKKGTFQGLYDPRFEHDNCGIGAVANIKGVKTHETVDQALHIVENLEHRAGKDAEGKTGDGVGIMLQISHRFFKKAAKAAGIGRSILRQAWRGRRRRRTSRGTCPGLPGPRRA